MINKSLGLAALLALATTTASAYYGNSNNNTCFCPHFYAGLEIGHSYSGDAHLLPRPVFNDADLDFFTPSNTSGDRDIGNAPIYGAYVGYQVAPTISFQLNYDHRSDYDWFLGVTGAETQQDFANVKAEEYRASIKLNTLMLNVKVNPAVNWCGFVPYVFAGIGASRNEISNVQDIGINRREQEPLFDIVTFGDKRTSFAWNTGVGVDYYVTKQAAFNISYRFADVGKVRSSSSFIDNVVPEDGILPTVPFVSERIILNEVLFGVTYHFS